MEKRYEHEFKLCKLVYTGMLVSVGLLLGIVELAVSGYAPFGLKPLMNPEQLKIVVMICAGAAVCAAAGGLAIHTGIRRMDPERPHVFFSAWARQLVNRRSSAMAMLIPPVACADMVVVLGFVMFLFSGGERMYFYVALVTALPLFLVTYPSELDAAGLAALDMRIRNSRSGGE
ncbi:MAG: hypothetical protein JXB03_00955 [Spirochaetales bacterium]|nr:hypothetical protein [Spirochaetales bacterium]